MPGQTVRRLGRSQNARDRASRPSGFANRATPIRRAVNLGTEGHAQDGSVRGWATDAALVVISR